MLAFLLSDPSTVLEPAGKAGLSLAESSILGAATVFFCIIAGLAVYKLSLVQDRRAADAKGYSERIEGLLLKMGELNNKMATTFASMENALTNLVQVEKDGQALLQSMKNSFDTVIRDAVVGRGGYRYGPSSSDPPPRKG